MNILKDLSISVSNGDVEDVLSILDSLISLDVKIRDILVDWPLLHRAYTVEMVKLIYSYGADINGKDNNGLTPLHRAVMHFKGDDVVQELLLLGANVNATDYEGNTPLMFAIIYENLDAIKILMENGADINIKSTSSFLGYTTSLSIAVKDFIHCAKIIVKIVIRKHYKDFWKIIDLGPLHHLPNHREISEYLEKCLNEIHLMKIKKVNKHLTILELVEKSVIVPVYVSNNNLKQEILNNYPIYHDVILPPLEPCIKRAEMLNKLIDLEICLTANKFDKVIILNTDCILKIANYLRNDDLNSFIETFCLN